MEKRWGSYKTFTPTCVNKLVTHTIKTNQTLYKNKKYMYKYCFKSVAQGYWGGCVVGYI